MEQRGTGPRSLIVALVVAALAALVPALPGCAADADPIAAAQAPQGDALDLSRAPWADVPNGNNHIGTAPEWPSLQFAPGITYAGALHRLYVAARTGAAGVADAEVGPPLPREVVYVAPATDADGLRLSLFAPWGWNPDDGAIGLPSVGMPAGLSHDEIRRRGRDAQTRGLALPEGGRVDVPQLRPCQIAVGTPEKHPPC